MTKFPRMDSLSYYITPGAPLSALRAREGSAIIKLVLYVASPVIITAELWERSTMGKKIL